MSYDLAENFDLTDRLRGWPGFQIGAAAGLLIALAWLYQVDLVPAALAGDAFDLGIGVQTIVLSLILAGLIWGLAFRFSAGVSWAFGLATVLSLTLGLVSALDVLLGWGVDWEIGERGYLSPEGVSPERSGAAMLAGALWMASSAALFVVVSFASAAFGATLLRRLARPWAGRVFPHLLRTLPTTWRQLFEPGLRSPADVSIDRRHDVFRRDTENLWAWRIVYARAVLVLAFVSAVSSQLWLEPESRIDAVLIFGVFMVLDAGFALAIGRTSWAFAPARRQLQFEAAISLTFGGAFIGLSIGPAPLTLEAFYALAAGWGVLTAFAQASVAFALRRGTSAQMLILYAVLMALTRFVYGIQQATAQEFLQLAYAQSLMLMGFAIAISFLTVLTGNSLRQWPRSEFEAAGRSART